MKKFIKNNLIGFILGAIIFTGISVYATIKVQANEIGYQDGTVEDALNDLYTKANGKKFCVLLSEQYGTKGNIGAKYACNLGDGIVRNFYILAVDGNTVKLIMETNLSDTVGSARMNYTTALNYLKSSGQGYSTVSSWTNVQSVDLPSAQDIADAAGITNWNVTTAVQNDWSYFGDNSQNVPSNRGDYTWLYDYTRGCVGYGSCAIEYSSSDSGKAYGYWTKDVVSNDSFRSWRVSCYGTLASNSATDDPGNGVRPVITLFKANLAG